MRTILNPLNNIRKSKVGLYVHYFYTYLLAYFDVFDKHNEPIDNHRTITA